MLGFLLTNGEAPDFEKFVNHILKIFQKICRNMGVMQKSNEAKSVGNSGTIGFPRPLGLLKGGD